MSEFDLRAMQLKELEILRDFADFCENNGIVYYLMYGTLIGAARHQGFIPWDDDIDVVMDVKNYKRFLKCAKRKYPDKYFVQNFRTERNVWFNWTKIRMNGTTSMNQELAHLDIHFGLCMDIFVLTGIPKGKLARRIQASAQELQSVLLNKYYSQMTGEISHPRAKQLYRWIPEKLRIPICRLLESILITDTHACTQCRNSDGISKTIFQSENFAGQGEMLLFEDRTYPVPICWREVLSRTYGNWQELPPESERYGHKNIIVDLEKDYTYHFSGRTSD